MIARSFIVLLRRPTREIEPIRRGTRVLLCSRESQHAGPEPEQDPEENRDLSEGEGVEREHPDTEARERCSERCEQPIVIITFFAFRSRCAGKPANGSYYQPRPCREADEADVENIVQPLIVEDRSISIRRVESLDSGPVAFAEQRLSAGFA